MCGIVAVLHPTIPSTKIQECFEEGKHRGPDDTAHVDLGDVWLGFHRLAINGLDAQSNQPFHSEDVYLICNGEIYNYRELFATLDKIPFSNSDCEIILHLYMEFGIEYTVHAIQASEFAFVLYDKRIDTMFIVRDPYGVRPLYKGTSSGMVYVASELKMMPPLDQVEHVRPGTITTICAGQTTCQPYCSLPSIQHISVPQCHVFSVLYNCVKKRVETTDRPMACLLSGGLDSSIIAYLVNLCRKELGITTPLETYSIGLKDAEDLRYAEIMAQHLQSNHTSIVVSEQDFLRAIPKVIYAIESRDTTTVRASVGNYLVCEYIRNHSDAKIIFNGDGADEVCGGYLYLKRAPNELEFDKECRRLVTDIHLFDAQRSDRSISSHGLESRTPFLDREFVELYLSLPPKVRFTSCEKKFLREAFVGMLPEIILWRKKEAFSDGVSSMQRSWFSIIQESIPQYIQDKYEKEQPSCTQEQFYYKTLYDLVFPMDLHQYYWMPKYSTTQDCSARTLEHYLTQTL
jgi:asparagine synthase (glutamine-hydrolysing)